MGPLIVVLYKPHTPNTGEPRSGDYSGLHCRPFLCLKFFPAAHPPRKQSPIHASILHL